MAAGTRRPGVCPRHPDTRLRLVDHLCASCHVGIVEFREQGVAQAVQRADPEVMHVRISRFQTALTRPLQQGITAFHNPDRQFCRSLVRERGHHHPATWCPRDQQLIQNSPDEHLCLTRASAREDLQHAILGPNANDRPFRATRRKRRPADKAEHLIEQIEEIGLQD